MPRDRVQRTWVLGDGRDSRTLFGSIRELPGGPPLRFRSFIICGVTGVTVEKCKHRHRRYMGKSAEYHADRCVQRMLQKYK